MGCGRAVALATNGHICGPPGDLPIVVTDLAPDLQSTLLEPQIGTTGERAPGFSVLSVEPDPNIRIDDLPPPSLQVTHVHDQVPDARTRQIKDDPETKIRPIEDLAPTIVKKPRDD